MSSPSSTGPRYQPILPSTVSGPRHNPAVPQPTQLQEQSDWELFLPNPDPFGLNPLDFMLQYPIGEFEATPLSASLSTASISHTQLAESIPVRAQPQAAEQGCTLVRHLHMLPRPPLRHQSIGAFDACFSPGEVLYIVSLACDASLKAAADFPRRRALPGLITRLDDEGYDDAAAQLAVAALRQLADPEEAPLSAIQKWLDHLPPDFPAVWQPYLTIQFKGLTFFEGCESRIKVCIEQCGSGDDELAKAYKAVLERVRHYQHQVASLPHVACADDFGPPAVIARAPQPSSMASPMPLIQHLKGFAESCHRAQRKRSETVDALARATSLGELLYLIKYSRVTGNLKYDEINKFLPRAGGTGNLFKHFAGLAGGYPEKFSESLVQLAVIYLANPAAVSVVVVEIWAKSLPPVFPAVLWPYRHYLLEGRVLVLQRLEKKHAENHKIAAGYARARECVQRYLEVADDLSPMVLADDVRPPLEIEEALARLQDGKQQAQNRKRKEHAEVVDTPRAGKPYTNDRPPAPDILQQSAQRALQQWAKSETVSDREKVVRGNVDGFVTALRGLLKRPEDPGAIESATGIALVLALMDLDASGLDLVTDVLKRASRWPTSIRVDVDRATRWRSKPPELAKAIDALFTKSLMKTPQQ